MTERIKHRLYILFLFLLSILAGGCENEQLLSPDQGDENKTVEITFYADPYTKAGNQDRITSISLWAFAHQKNGTIINFTQKNSNSGELTITMESNFFENNSKDEKVSYTTLYAIANANRITPSGLLAERYSTLETYTNRMNEIQRKYLTAKPPTPISLEQENMLKELITASTAPSGTIIDMSTPIMASTLKVTGGASRLSMPLERAYCRIRFTFIITGSQTTDRLTINSIKLSNLKSETYVFLDEAIPAAANHENSWTYTPDDAVFQTGENQYKSQPLTPGNTALTLCATASTPEPFYFYSYQSIGDTETIDPIITLEIINEDGIAKTLTAPLYDPVSSGGKKHHGLHRNHSYEVISTINAGSLKLEGVTTRSHDWFDRGEVEFPPFQ